MPDGLTQSTCRARTADGTPCQRRVKQGSGPCFAHAEGLGRKIRAWARNNTIIFALTILFGVVSVVSLCGWAFDEFVKRPTGMPTAAQAEEINKLDQFLAQHDELQLQKQFEFDAMIERNILLVKDRIIAFRKTGDKYAFNITPYQFDGGQISLETKELPARRQGPGSVGVGPLPADRVFLIMLPKE
jgi:hypothetical protein